MADNEIVSVYRIKVDQLASDVNAIVAEYAKADKAGTDSASRVSTEFSKQATIISGIREQINRLTDAQKKATNPADVERINKALAQQSALLIKQEQQAKKIYDAQRQQVGIIDTLRNRIDQLTKARDKADNVERIERINKLIREQQQRVDGLTGSLKNVEGEGNAVTRTINDIGEKIVAAFAVERIIAFGEASIQAFVKAEAQTDKLRFSVEKLSGQGTGAFDRLIAQSKELAAGKGKSFFDDEDIQQVQAMLTQFGLTADQVEKLVPGILDLSVALDTDLNGATQTVISALTGTTRGLKQIGGDFKDAGTPVANYNKLLEVLPKVAGAAENALHTASGEMRAQETQAENLQEIVGEKLTGSYIKLKNVLLEAAAGLLGVRKNMPTDRVEVFSNLLSDKNIPTEKIQQRLEATRASIASAQAEQKRLTDEINKSIIPSKESSDKIVDLANSILILKDKETALSNALRDRSEQQKNAVKNAEREKLVSEDITKLTSKELEARIEALKQRDDANNATVQSAIQLAETQLEKAKQTEQKASDDAVQKRKAAIEQLIAINDKYNEQRLQSFTKTELDSLEVSRQVELARAKIQFQKAGGRVDASGNLTGDAEAVKLFKEAEQQINATFDEKIADAKIKKALEVQQQLRQISEQNLQDDLNATLNTIDIAAQQQINRERQAFNERGDFTAAAEQQLQDRLNKIAADAQQKKIAEQIKFAQDQQTRLIDQTNADAQRLKDIEIEAFKKRGDDSEQARQRLNDRLNEIDQDAALKTVLIQQNADKQKEKSEQDLTKAKADEAAKQLDNQQKNAQREIELRKRVFDQSKDLISELFNLESQIAEGKIQDLEFQKQQNQDATDAEQEKLQADLDNRIITQKQFENQSAELKKQRVASEKKINDQINAEKRKQDLANRVRALFEIGINTAVGIMTTTKELGFPAAIPMIALIGALGIAQAAAVLATPLPKYAKGEKYLRRRNGEPMGTDTIAIMADEGERIIPRKQNVKHWRIYESLDDGTFDDYVNNKYVVPALSAAKRKYQKMRDDTFSNNIMQSIMIDKNDPDKQNMFYEFTRLWNRGIRINNIDELSSGERLKSIYTQ